MSGSLTITAEPDTLAGIGDVVISGNLTVAINELSTDDTDEILTGDGVDLTLDADETNVVPPGTQTIIASASVLITSALTATQGEQTLSAQGGPIAGLALTATQQPQTVAGAGTVLIGGALATTANGDTLTGDATVLVVGQITGSQSDTITASGDIEVAGDLGLSQENQTISAQADAIIGGSLVETQGPNTIAASGTVNGITGALTETQGANTIVGSIGLWQTPINICLLPKMARVIIIPSEEQEMFGAQPEPPAFDAMDPDDQDVFTFDWSQNANPGDTILSASVVASSSDLISSGPAIVVGLQVQATYTYSQTARPQVYSLRCSVAYASGRKRHWTIPLPVQAL